MGGNADSVYKVFYTTIAPNLYKGDHDFTAVFFWGGGLGRPPNEFTVTFFTSVGTPP